MNDDARPAPEPQDMPPHSGAADEPARQDPSRRSVLWTTAGVAGAGIGLGALGTGNASAAESTAPQALSAAEAAAAAPARQGRTMAGVRFEGRSTI
ncbi:gfo/Idh/MocA family oxidoreductase, partial [Streptomyces sp. SID724]|nr:gfo/Idh/MocA family oxidoreductase [Streptomyces sp. SID724]